MELVPVPGQKGRAPNADEERSPGEKYRVDGDDTPLAATTSLKNVVDAWRRTGKSKPTAYGAESASRKC
jgi:hypothetical protein